MSYNYIKASNIFKKYYNLVCDPWTFDSYELQHERRLFMRALTRHDMEYLQLYIDHIEDEKNDVCIGDDGKSKYFDFDLMRQYDEIKNDIINF